MFHRDVNVRLVLGVAVGTVPAWHTNITVLVDCDIISVTPVLPLMMALRLGKFLSFFIFVFSFTMFDGCLVGASCPTTTSIDGYGFGFFFHLRLISVHQY